MQVGVLLLDQLVQVEHAALLAQSHQGLPVPQRQVRARGADPGEGRVERQTGNGTARPHRIDDSRLGGAG